ncbi:hypothetical protein F2P81_023535 [Scophthalmus maximus]|uniref:Transmembrane protein 196 n=1 Tax=Scophthalmus maximus TaxID=52904 RepID=A0A6A4RRT8_SCOMX|nr:hypothetical protein F2P81_023535 [Scophthalmus maximus]
MCSSRKILWSLLLLSVVEVGLGVASIVLGAVGIIRVRGEHKAQQGDASPVWSGLCVRPVSGLWDVWSAVCSKEDWSHWISSCTLSTWLTCRLASSEQQRMFLEREHSLHHSHEMTEKEVLDNSSNGIPQISYNGHTTASP